MRLYVSEKYERMKWHEICMKKLPFAYAILRRLAAGAEYYIARQTDNTMEEAGCPAFF